MTEMIDINTADVETLDSLPYVGESIAQQIINLRPFASWEEFVDKVDGIGPNNVEKIRAHPGVVLGGVAVAPELGYNPHFLGVKLPLPDIGSDQDLIRIDHTHFSLNFDRRERVTRIAAANVDMARFRRVDIGRTYVYDCDKRVLREEQYNDAWYKHDMYDKGHMVRRHTVSWGDKAEDAVNESDMWTNFAPHHNHFHADEWRGVEAVVLDSIIDYGIGQKGVVFTGSHFDAQEKQIDQKHGTDETRNFPTAFWKAVFFQHGDPASPTLHWIAFWVPHTAHTTQASGKDLKLLRLGVWHYQIKTPQELFEKTGVRAPEGAVTIL